MELSIPERVHDLETKYDCLQADIHEIKQVINKIYLLGWGMFITVLGWTVTALFSHVTLTNIR